MDKRESMTLEGENSKIPVTAEAYKMLKERIVTLKMLPGQLLMVQQLSKEYGISRTPVREALIRLNEEGLVIGADGRKFQVSYITWKLISDIYNARQAVEVVTIANAARNYDEEMENELEKIAAHLLSSCETRQYGAYFEADNAFHDLLLQRLDNSVMQDWMERIADQRQRIRYATMGIGTSVEVSCSEHLAMISAIREQDAQNASALMGRHLQRALQDLLKLRNQANPYLTAFIQD